MADIEILTANRASGLLSDGMETLDRARLYAQARQTLLRKGLSPQQTYSVRTVLELTGWQHHELDYRVKNDVLHPNITRRGAKAFREFSFQDIEEALVVKYLEEKGNSVAAIKALLRQWRQGSPSPQRVQPAYSSLRQIASRCQARLLYITASRLLRREIPAETLVALYPGTPADHPHLVKVLREQADSILLSLPAERAIVGLLTSTGEMITLPHPSQPLPERTFYLAATPKHHLLLGLPTSPEGHALDLARDEDWELMDTILDFCLRLESISFERPLPSPAESHRPYIQDTPVSAMAQLIVLAYPELYCLIYGPPYATGSLKLKAVSYNFPVPLNPTISIRGNQLLSGWAYENGQEIIVERATGPDDPRIANQPEEKATSALAVPTRVASKVNGAIYLGTRRVAEEHPFPQAKVRFFRILGAIVGEMIEGESLAGENCLANIDLFSEKTLPFLRWTDFAPHLCRFLKEIRKGALSFPDRSFLIILASVDREAWRKIKPPEVAAWAAEKLRHAAARFCQEKGLENLTGFLHEEGDFALLAVKEFPSPQPSSQWGEGELGRLLNSLISSLGLPVHSWVFRFSYDELYYKLEKSSEEELADFLAGEVSALLQVIKLAAEGDEAERQGQDMRAIARYQHASYLSPQSALILYRLARAWAQRGNFSQALELCQKALALDETNPDVLECLGQIYTCMGEYEQARMAYEKALSFRPESPKLHCLLGESFALQGREHCEQAVRKFRDAATCEDLNDHRRQAMYYWLSYEVYMQCGEVEKAIYEVQQALNLDPENAVYRYALRKALAAR